MYIFNTLQRYVSQHVKMGDGALLPEILEAMQPAMILENARKFDMHENQNMFNILFM